MSVKISKKYVPFSILIITSLFFPYYQTSSSGLNETFLLTTLCASFCIFYIRITEKRKNNIFTLVYFMTLLIFLGYSIYVNVKYDLKCIWIIINQFISFWFFISLYNFVTDHKNMIPRIKDILTDLFLYSNILSLGYKFLGGDAIRFHDCSIVFRRAGTFLDNRLTFIYTHKSVYGLLLLLFLVLLLENHNIRNRKLKIAIIFVTLYFVNSAVSMVCCVIVLMYYLLNIYWSRMKLHSKILFTFVAIAIVILMFLGLFDIVKLYRDVDSLGGRMAIWAYAISYLKYNRIGIGDSFGGINYSSNELSFVFNNFHNVFLNEMLQISVVSGIMFAFLFLVMYCNFIRVSRVKFKTIFYLLILLLPITFDQAISTAFMPIYFMLMVLIFNNDEMTNKRLIKRMN